MPVEPGGFVPGSVVEDEHAAFAGFGWDRLGEVIEVALEDVGIDAVEDHGKALASGWANGPDDVGPDVLAQVGHLWPTAAGTPAAAGTRVTLDSAFVTIPEFHPRILAQRVEL